MSTQHADDNQSDAPAYKDPETLHRLYWDEGKSHREMADELGVSHTTVSKYMDKYDIEKRERITASRRKLEQTHVGLVHHQGYQIWRHNHNDNQYHVKVSRLLAVAKYGFDAVQGKDVHHKNEVKWLDYHDNIELLDRSDHIKHHHNGSRSSCAKLTEPEVREIRGLAREGDIQYKDIADMYDVSPQTITAIVKRRSWTHIE